MHYTIRIVGLTPQCSGIDSCSHSMPREGGASCEHRHHDHGRPRLLPRPSLPAETGLPACVEFLGCLSHLPAAPALRPAGSGGRVRRVGGGDRRQQGHRQGVRQGSLI